MLRRDILRSLFAGIVCLVESGLMEGAAYATPHGEFDTLNSDLNKLLSNPSYQEYLRMPNQSVWRASVTSARNHGMFGNIKSERMIPDQAIALIISLEVGGAAYFASKHLEHFVFPGGASGPTIGMGYDVGQLSNNSLGLKNLHDDWDSVVSPDLVKRLAQGLGKTGQDAISFVAQNQDVSVPWKVADAQLRNRMIPYLIGDLLSKQNLPPGAEKMPDRCLGALCSLVYNRGMAFKAPGPRYVGMRNIYLHIATGNLELIPNELLEMRKLWPKTNGLWGRRIAEGKMFQAGLLEQGLPVVPLDKIT